MSNDAAVTATGLAVYSNDGCTVTLHSTDCSMGPVVNLMMSQLNLTPFAERGARFRLIVERDDGLQQ